MVCAGRVGAYGLAITGLSGANGRLMQAPAHWRQLHLVQARPPADTATVAFVDDERAFVPLDHDHAVSVDRRRRTAVVLARSDRDDERLAHPLLVIPASLFAHWEGRAALHGGAFVAGARAWGVLGDKRAGKSTTLAALALAAAPIIADDLLVVDRLRVLRGPQHVDLRPSSARRLDLPRDVKLVRRRHRLRPPAAPAEVPLGGWVFLAWGRRPALRRLTRSDALRRIAQRFSFPALDRDPLQLLELASRPAFELVRPHTMAGIAETTRWLMELGG